MGDVERVEAALVAIRRRQSRRVLARSQGVSGQAFDVLDVIEAGGAESVSSIAQALGVDQPRASRLVAAAVEAGLVTREADQSDGRRSTLSVTSVGAAAIEQAHAARRAVFGAAMGDWSAAERAQFADLLTRFVTALPE